MNFKLTCLFLLCFINKSFAQKDNFYNGYIITNNGDSLHCEIKDEDWISTPAEFKYRFAGSQNIQIALLDSTREINAFGQFKYIRYTGNIDVSSGRMNELSTKRDPEFERKTVFLETLVEGKANLYFYSNSRYRRFFYKLDNGEITQLTYKKYESAQNVVSTNEDYKFQLLKELNCKFYTIDKYKYVEYRIRSLSNYFKEYNSCFGVTATSSVRNERKGIINIYGRAGIGSSNFRFNHRIDPLLKGSHGTQPYFSIGFGAEILIPKTDGVLYFLIEPSFQNHVSSGGKVEPNNFKTTLEYRSMEVPIGLKLNFKINEKVSSYIKGLYSGNISMSRSKITFSPQGYIMRVGPDANLEFGGGITLNKKYSAEFRFSTNRPILNNYPWYNSNFTTIELVLGYRLFKL